VTSTNVLFPLQFPDLHGHRGLEREGFTCEGDLCVDRAALSVLQDGAQWLEEQCAPQSVAEQELCEGGEGAEYGQRFAVACGAAAAPESHPGVESIALLPQLGGG